MASDALCVGVIGIGGMGWRHARALTQMPDVRLVGVADIDERRLAEARDALGVDTYVDYRDLLSRLDLMAVDICMPDGLHVAPVRAAAAAGKHMLLEKPIATTAGDGRAIIDACRQAGVKLMVGHLLRFDPRYASVKDAITVGHLGEVVQIVTHRNSPWTEGPVRYAPGTSLTLHVAVHDLDIVNWYMDRPPRCVYGGLARRRLIDRRMDDAGSALVLFEGGAVASVNYGWILPPESVTKLDARLEVVGTRGMALVGVPHGQGVFIAGEDRHAAPDVHHVPVTHGRIGGDLVHELRAFLEYVVYDRQPPLTPEDALLAVAEAEAIEASAAAGQPIAVPPILGVSNTVPTAD